MYYSDKFNLDIGWLLILKDMGIDAGILLKKAGLPGDLFARKSLNLSIEEYFRLWEALTESYDKSMLPLKLGQAISVEAFNPPLFAAFCSPNIDVCMNRFSRFKRLIGPMIMDVNKNDKLTEVEIRCLGTDIPLPPMLVVTEFVFMVHLIRLATRENIIPSTITTQADLNHHAYKDFFGVEPKRGDRNLISFSASDITKPFLTKNEQMWKFFEPELQKRLDQLDQEAGFLARVQSSLLELLPSGAANIENASKMLGVSKRTLQRRLGEEGSSFQIVLNQTRKRLADHYLKQSSISHAEISFLIGFDDPNSFIRAFHKWTGVTPENYRKQFSMA